MTITFSKDDQVVMVNDYLEHRLLNSGYSSDRSMVVDELTSDGENMVILLKDKPKEKEDKP